LPPSGRTLQSRYQLQGLIENNLIFNLYIAKDLHFAGKSWLIKEMKIFSQDPITRNVLSKQFNEKASQLTRIENSNLPKIIDYFMEDGLNYMVMEYRQGQTLKSLMKNTPVLDENQVLEIGTQLAEIIEYLHNSRPPVLLLNLNPSHIYVHSQGIYLIEYGFSPIIAQAGKVQYLLEVSEGYCAPEMLQPKVSADNKTDIYSLGVILHQLLTGSNPKDSLTVSSVKITNPDISDQFDNLIKKATKIKANERFPSIIHFKKEISRIPRSVKKEFNPKFQKPVQAKQSFTLEKFATIVPERSSNIERLPSSNLERKSSKSSGRFSTISDDAEIGRKSEALRSQGKPMFKTQRFVLNDEIEENSNEIIIEKKKNTIDLKSFSKIGLIIILILLIILGLTLIINMIFNKNNQVNSNPVSNYKTVGIENYRNGNYVQAIENLTKAATTEPSDGLLNIYIQNSYLEINKTPYNNIGISVPLTGYISHNGEDIIRGIAFAQKKINGTENSTSLNFTVEDDKSSMAGAIEVANLFCNKPEIAAVIGNITSDLVKSTAPIYNSNKMVSISPTGICPDIPDLGNYIYRLSGKNDIETQTLVDFCIKQSGFSKIGIIYDETQDYSVAMSRIFKEKIIENKGSIIIEKTFTSGSSDFSYQINDIIKSNPDVLFCSGYYKDIANIAIQLRKSGSNIQLIGGDSLYTQDMINTGGTSVEGIIFTSTFYSDYNDKTREFTKEFFDTFRVLPSARAALAYDATMIISNVINQTGSDRNKIKDYMKTINNETNGIEGITGKTFFDENGNSARDIFVLTVKNGKFIIAIH
jgi:branched-chain amino acid transport system substrate-binding protein